MLKQSIKEFFRPTKWRVISFILLISIFEGWFILLSFPTAGGCNIPIGRTFFHFLGWPILLMFDSTLCWFVFSIVFSIFYLFFLICCASFFIKKVRQSWHGKSIKIATVIILLLLAGILLASFYNDTENIKLYCGGGSTGESRIKSTINQARIVMLEIYENEKNFDNFTCQHEYMRFLCKKIFKNYQRYQNDDNRKMAISHDAWVNSQAACIYSPLDFSGHWYCSDSIGVAGETKIDPGTPGYCVDGQSAKCPPIVGE